MILVGMLAIYVSVMFVAGLLECFCEGESSMRFGHIAACMLRLLIVGAVVLVVSGLLAFGIGVVYFSIKGI